MEWHINDLSLDGQFSDPTAFRSALEPLLQLRLRDTVLRSRLYCSRTLHTRRVTAHLDLRQTVLGMKDKTFKSLVLDWMAKSGPFWDDHRQYHEDDYFEYRTNDVTDQGLGEAARRKLIGLMVRVFSFQGSRFSFAESPLSVQHGLPEAPIAKVEIDNDWEIEKLEESIRDLKILRCWEDVRVEIIRRFHCLIIPDKVMDALLPTPFSEQVAKRIFNLLQVLDDLVAESDEKGELTNTGKELLTEHFMGMKAWFSDESRGNKAKFRQEMTFPDPENPTDKIFCPWHGKIKTPQIRIHFQWPRPVGQTSIKVVYIGPKITKG